MPKTLLVETYDESLHKRRGCTIKNLKIYDLGNGVRVKLAKETNPLTKYAVWGLKAITDIPKGFCLGYFVKKQTSTKFIEGFYNIALSKHNYFVADENSLMNKANTICYTAERRKKTNCRLFIHRGKAGLRTTKQIKKNTMVWADYGNVPKHYWKIQYCICQARHTKKRNRRGTKNNKDEDNDDSCLRCKKRDELVLCDACPNAICEQCLTTCERFILSQSDFFCANCMQKPITYPNRFG